MRTVTLLDLRLGLVQFTPEQQERMRAALPILARVALRQLQQQRAAQTPAASPSVHQVAVGQQDE